MVPFLWGHVSGPAAAQAPRCREAVRELPPSGQGQVDAPPYLRFALGLGREQNPHPELITYPFGVHVVR